MNVHNEEAPDAKLIAEGDHSLEGSPMSSKVFPLSTKLSDIDSQIDAEIPKPEPTRKLLNHEDLPKELSSTMDKVVYQLDLLSRTMIALERRLTLSEDKMNDIIDFMRETDPQKSVKTSQILERTTIVKNIDPSTLK